MKLLKKDRISGEYEMTENDIITQFHRSRYYEQYLDGKFPYLDVALRLFIENKDGLGSAITREDVNKVVDVLILNESRK